jgi:methyl-accepting chemotaxis protein
MTTSEKLDRKLSLSQRLATLGLAAFVGFGSMLAVGWYENSRVDQALDRAIVAQDAIKNASAMRLRSVELTLVAMDVIVDRGDRKVSPERQKLIADSIAVLEAGKPAAMELAASVGKPEIMATFNTDLTEMTKVIQSDLKTMVEDGAAPEAFDAVDDAIDGAGERMTTSLGKLYDEAGTALGARVAEATARSAESIQLQLALGLLAMSLLLGLLYFHGNILRRGVFAIRDNMQRILGGDYQTAVQSVNRGDEIGEMARSVEMFRAAAVEKRELEQTAAASRNESEIEREAREAASAEEARQVQRAVTALGQGLNRLSDGNLTATINQPFRQDLETLRQDFNHTVEKLQGVLSNVQENSSSIQANSRQMRCRRRSCQADGTAGCLAGGNLRGARSDHCDGAHRHAECRGSQPDGWRNPQNAEESGRIVVARPSKPWRGSKTRRREIGKIINVIDEIAFQTNLWRSMPASRRRAPVKPARALRSSPRKCANWPAGRRCRQGYQGACRPLRRRSEDRRRSW